MKRIPIFAWCVLCCLSLLLFSCNQRDLKKKPLQEKIDKLNSDADKVEKATMAYAATDTNLGAYDSIKFVSLHPYTKIEYCQLMQQILSKQNEKANEDLEQYKNDANKLVELDQQLIDIREATDFYTRTIYNMKITEEDNPTVMFEAKCYVYIDGYIFEPIYHLNTKYKIFTLDPYDFDFIK